MRHFVSESAESYAVGVVDVARWEQYSLGATMPFQAMWYSLPPSSSSPRDCHPEVELSIVVKGTASVETEGRITDIAAGSAFLLSSEEAHVIHNRADDLLLVFSAYWMPAPEQAGQGSAPAQAGQGSAPAQAGRNSAQVAP